MAEQVCWTMSMRTLRLMAEVGMPPCAARAGVNQSLSGRTC